jgi:hypothetical protein
MNATSFADLRSTCMSSMTATSIGALSSEQIAAMPENVFKSFAKFGDFTPAACAGLTKAQVGMFASSYPNSQCDSFKVSLQTVEHVMC